MKTHAQGFGGTINADLQCSVVYTASSFSLYKPFAVHNCCKDGWPSEYWVCVRLFTPFAVTKDASEPAAHHFVYLDARHFGLHTNVVGELSRNRRDSTRVLRDFMVHQLRSGAWSVEKLLAYASERSLPQICRLLA